MENYVNSRKSIVPNTPTDAMNKLINMVMLFQTRFFFNNLNCITSNWYCNLFPPVPTYVLINYYIINEQLILSNDTKQTSLDEITIAFCGENWKKKRDSWCSACMVFFLSIYRSILPDWRRRTITVCLFIDTWENIRLLSRIDWTLLTLFT